MPRDYSKTVLYKIVCKDINITDCYVGHTINFDNRKSKHKSDCNNEKTFCYNFKLYQFIRANGGFENFEIIKIEDYPCNDIYEAVIKEGYFIKELKATLNMKIAGRTNKEYRKDNKELLSEKDKEYYKNNKELILEKAKEYHKLNKNKKIQYDKQYCENNKEKIAKRNKKYFENNKEKNAEKQKEYYKNNKELISEKNKEKITCECGCIIRKNGLLEHLKSKKHINLIINK
jgi:hypothetical protein